MLKKTVLSARSSISAKAVMTKEARDDIEYSLRVRHSLRGGSSAITGFHSAFPTRTLRGKL